MRKSHKISPSIKLVFHTYVQLILSTAFYLSSSLCLNKNSFWFLLHPQSIKSEFTSQFCTCLFSTDLQLSYEQQPLFCPYLFQFKYCGGCCRFPPQLALYMQKTDKDLCRNAYPMQDTSANVIQVHISIRQKCKRREDILLADGFYQLGRTVVVSHLVKLLAAV